MVVDSGQEGSERAKKKQTKGDVVGGIFCLALKNGVRQCGEATVSTRMTAEHREKYGLCTRTEQLTPQ